MPISVRPVPGTAGAAGTGKRRRHVLGRGRETTPLPAAIIGDDDVPDRSPAVVIAEVSRPSRLIWNSRSKGEEGVVVVWVVG